MSTVKVNTIDKRTGSTLTLGGSGTAVTLACGATQTGFGRTGTVNWQTASIKTGTFTAVSGEGYFVNTSGGVSTANLPAGSAGAIVSFSDYTRTFATNNLTVSPNGSEKIGGIAQDLILDVNGQALTLVYVDATEGWINVQNAEDTETGLIPYLTATGGTITTSGDFKIHTFTSSGTFAVSELSGTPSRNVVDYLNVAGGGGGGQNGGGGGAAGGARMSAGTSTGCYTSSPLGSGVSGITVTTTSFPITVGAAGAGSSSGPAKGANGTNSVFSTITSAGGGGGGSTGSEPGSPGGSGGGVRSNGSGTIGAGNTPPVSPPQGNSGGAPSSGDYRGTGGGGASTVGGSGADGSFPGGGGGGTGITNAITGSSLAYAGGGSGGANGCSTPSGSTCGTGGGGGQNSPGPTTAGAGTTNRGGGGGGGSGNPPFAGGNGGSGVVVIRYKFQ
tara:strand:- start:19 stop:1353 length:1335 start_codon:yes stop_codon:yes gene_type:complete